MIISCFSKNVWAVTQTRGISFTPSARSSRRRRPSVVTNGSWCLSAPTKLLLTFWVFIHSKKQWWRSAGGGFGQYLQRSDMLGRILASLCSEGRSLWSNFHKKLVTSGPRSFNLAFLQLSSQSVPGAASSTLGLMNSMVLLSSSTRITSFSSKTLYHWAVDIVEMFRGVFSFTHLMQEKINFSINLLHETCFLVLVSSYIYGAFQS